MAQHVIVPHNIPKRAFILWLLCTGRLATKDRLIECGLEVEPTCFLCSQLEETDGEVQHIYFKALAPPRFGMSFEKNEVTELLNNWKDELHKGNPTLKEEIFQICVH